MSKHEALHILGDVWSVLEDRGVAPQYGTARTRLQDELLGAIQSGLITHAILHGDGVDE